MAYPLNLADLDARSLGRMARVFEECGISREELLTSPFEAICAFLRFGLSRNANLTEGERVWYLLFSTWWDRVKPEPGKDASFPLLPLKGKDLEEFVKGLIEEPVFRGPGQAGRVRRWRWVDFHFPTSVIAKATETTDAAVSMARSRLMEAVAAMTPELLSKNTGLSVERICALASCDAESAFEDLFMFPATLPENEEDSSSEISLDGKIVPSESLAGFGAIARVAAEKGLSLERAAHIMNAVIAKPFAKHDSALDVAAGIPDGATALMRVDAVEWEQKRSGIHSAIIGDTNDMHDFFRVFFRSVPFQGGEDIIMALTRGANLSEEDAVRVLWAKFGRDIRNFMWSLFGGNSSTFFENERRVESIYGKDTAAAALSDLLCCAGPVLEKYARKEKLTEADGFSRGMLTKNLLLRLLEPETFAGIAKTCAPWHGFFYGPPSDVTVPLRDRYKLNDRVFDRILETLGILKGMEEFRKNMGILMEAFPVVSKRLLQNNDGFGVILP